MNDTPTPREEFEEWLETFYDNSNILSPRSLAWAAWQAASEELTAAREYADKLAAGLPDGMLPKDVEVLREANLGLAVELTAVTEQRDRLAEALERIANNNIQDTQQTDYAYELGRMEGIAKVALQSLNPDHFPDVGNMIGTTTPEP